ncbi:MAG: hypothetical protein O9267_00900 [Flavobacterium sp.]|uniref:hypothetical protein n=1 Tax=Flavobacterium sp. TaxID=239 RepID=UPI0022C05577|nr:hypothetical protein [Flavobacterium sp.]MCZ8196146.1 hypothetical protein [Flavobacterium sp.]
MKSQLLKCLLLCLLTALLTYFLTCYFCKKKFGDIPENTRSLTDICMDYDTITPPTLTTEMVKSMVTQYSGAQLNSIQTASTNAVAVDARSIWFDLETLKEFLYQIEHNVNKNPTQGRDKELGVRIYYAAYPDNTKMRDLAATQTDPNFSYNPAYEKKHTLVMIPTIEKDGKNYDFNPLDVNSYIGFTNMKAGGPYSPNSSSYATLSLGTSANPLNPLPNPTIVRNHGILNPPATSSGMSF